MGACVPNLFEAVPDHIRRLIPAVTPDGHPTTLSTSVFSRTSLIGVNRNGQAPNANRAAKRITGWVDDGMLDLSPDSAASYRTQFYTLNDSDRPFLAIGGTLLSPHFRKKHDPRSDHYAETIKSIIKEEAKGRVGYKPYLTCREGHAYYIT